MSYKNIRRLVCDGFYAALTCREFYESWHNISKADFIKEAKKDGWVIKNGKHYCPECWEEIFVNKRNGD